MADKKISALTAASVPLAGTEVLPIVQSGSTVKVTIADVTAGRDVAANKLTTGSTGGVTTGGAYSLILGTNNSLATASSVTIDTNGSVGVGVSPTQPLHVRRSTDTVFLLDCTTVGYGSFFVQAALGVTYVGAINSTPLAIFAGGAEVGRFTTAGNYAPAAGKGIDFSANTHAAGMTSELLNDYEEGNWTPVDGSGAGLSITKNEAYYTRIGRVVYFYLDVTYPATANGSLAYLAGLPFAPSKDGGGSIGYQNIASATQLFANVSQSLSGVRILDITGITLVNSALSGKRFQIAGQYIV